MTVPYIDTAAIIQVLAGVYLNNSLLDNPDYFFNEDDFPNEFHKIIFGTIYNLHMSGVDKVSVRSIEDYLDSKPKSLATYKSNHGDEYLEELENNAQLDAFDYYYQRMKKMTLLREYQKIGFDCSWFYDNSNLLDSKKRELQEERLDKTTLNELAEKIDNRITKIRLKYVEDANGSALQAGTNGLEILEKLRKTPAYGYPMYGKYINTLFRGARLGKFYLVSAPTGVGKSRTMIAQACYIGCDYFYNLETNQWEYTGRKEPTLYISTELQFDEVFTMMIAFISGVNEEHILTNRYLDGEWERVLRANEILNSSPIYTQLLPDFTLKDVENSVKRGVNDYHIKYVFHDYLHSSISILSEVGGKSGVKGLREDNILFLISVKLKDLANQFGIFIMSATQMNGKKK